MKNLYEVKSGVRGKLEFGYEANLFGLTGTEIIDRINRFRELTLEAGGILSAGSLIPHNKQDFEIEIKLSDKKKFSVYLTYDGKWYLGFRDEDSTRPFKGNISYFVNPPQFQTYSRKTTKFEDKAYQMIIDFIDKGIMP
jgi:hypothetical protein